MVSNKVSTIVQGVPIQKKFTKGIEKLMGADQSITPLTEPLVDIFPKVKKPTYKSVEEDVDFTEQVRHIIFLSYIH